MPSRSFTINAGCWRWLHLFFVLLAELVQNKKWRGEWGDGVTRSGKE